MQGRERRYRRLRSEAMARRRRQSIRQLVLACLALVMLLLAWNQLATGAAGCFTYATGAGAGDATGSTTSATHDAAGTTPGPSIRVVVPTKAPHDNGGIE